MRMRVAPSEYLYGFQVEVGPFEADGGSGRPKYLSSDPAAGAAFATAAGGNAFGTPATYVLNNPPTLASVGSSDITFYLDVFASTDLSFFPQAQNMIP